uniref:Probable inactive serine/threonine-protein kinase bub1 n=1 Tax=Nicotiana tabacum TaxID=4097 RepID=A0A1S4C8M6_TOBAC|nr:PREDICTED: probable inactive serine/threonine-protein kinase bub1 [Nicotiana tabacum]
MSITTSMQYNDLFSSLVSDIKSYNGKDPLCPWLRGIKKMKESLPPQLLKEKLPRFLQKCAQTFETDRRYANDMRYLRVWLRLMEYVDEPKTVLKTMELNRIGMKKSAFYIAYALYYEKVKKFEAAEKMYRLGVQNLAEPLDELHKSYEEFLHRMEHRKNKRIQRQEGKNKICPLGAKNITSKNNEIEENDENLSGTENNPISIRDQLPTTRSKHLNMKNKVAISQGSRREFTSEDTVVVKFVGNAIVGKSAVEDARHHGLVEPTINTKEAIYAINNMFRGPLEPSLAGKHSRRNQPKVDQRLNNGFEVFIDENTDGVVGSSHQTLANGSSVPQATTVKNQKPMQEPFQIFIDDDNTVDVIEGIHEKDKSDMDNSDNLTGCTIEERIENGFVFPRPSDVTSECSGDPNFERPPQTRLRREDTVVYKFVGSTISEESQVENVCHHGLVEPTINLKEAMDDINSMFGKPIEFTRKSRPKKREQAPKMERDDSGFMILPDDEIHHQPKSSLPTSTAERGSDLFEQTVCTKEAMDDINKMFAMPLDF